jgi:hypothetical protein
MDSNLQNKLYHFEANPPQEVWDKIAESLDTEETFPERLFRYEVQPPPQAWSMIEASLDQANTPAKVIPLSRYKKPLRYIAAASTIAIVLAITTLNTREPGGNITQANTKTSLPINQASVLPLPKKPVLVEEPAPMSPTVVTTARTEKAGRVYRKTSAPKKELGVIDPQNAINSVSLSGQFIPDEVNKEQMFDFSVLDNYMVCSDGNGNAIKLSKKLFSLVSCPTGDGSCKERIHQLRQKLTANTVSTDFAGLLEIVRQLQ